MKSPSVYPSYSKTSLSPSRPDDNKTYMQFAQATFAVTDKSSLVAMAQCYLDDCKSKFSQIVYQSMNDQSELSYLKDMLIPAATDSLNNIAKSGKFQSINDANTFKSSAIKSRDLAMGLQNANAQLISTVNVAVIALADAFNNISDPSSTISSSQTGQSANYWARIVYLWQFDFNTWSEKFTSNSQKEIDYIASSSADIGKIFDIDDAANGDKSYRSTHKVATSKSALDEKEKQELLAKSEEFYKYLKDQAAGSPIAYFLNMCIVAIAGTGTLYTACPAEKPVYTPPQISTGMGSFAEIVSAVTKFNRNTFVWDLCNGKFNESKKITDREIAVIMAVNGGAFTMDSLKNSINGVFPIVKLPSASLTSAFTRLKAVNLSALSNNTFTNSGGLSQIGAIAAAAAKAKVCADARLAADKAAKDAAEAALAHASESEKKAMQDKIIQLQAEIDKGKQSVIDADVKAKEADAKKLLEEKTNATDHTKELPVVPTVVPTVVPLTVEPEEIQKKLIFGIPAPYVIGGGIAAIALLVIASRRG